MSFRNMSAEKRKREIEMFPVSRRIHELESYMQVPKYHNQCTNLEAIIKLYKLGELNMALSLQSSHKERLCHSMQSPKIYCLTKSI